MSGLTAGRHSPECPRPPPPPPLAPLAVPLRKMTVPIPMIVLIGKKGAGGVFLTAVQIGDK